MKYFFNKNIDGIWYRIEANENDINKAKIKTISSFDESINILDIYKKNRNNENKRKLTENEEIIFIKLFNSNFIYNLENIIDEKIEKKEIDLNRKSNNPLDF